MTVIIANSIDFVAALIQTASGTIRQKQKILAVQILQLLLQATSMAMLGGMTGAVSNILSCWRNYLCYKDKLTGFKKFLLIAASILMTVLLNDQGIWGILPAAVCTVYILLMDVKDPVKFKLLVTVSFLPWMLYHFAIRSYVGAFFDFATIVTNSATLVSMIRSRRQAAVS